MRNAVGLSAILLVVCTWSIPGVARDGPVTARQILEKMETTVNGFDDQSMDITMTVVDVDGSRKSYDFTILQKGDTQRMIRFTSGEMKGMATLVEGRNRIYVYLPGYGKVRRVAAHNMNQSFAGSDFTNQDMAVVKWSESFDATIQRQDEDHWYLKCIPKTGTDDHYAWVVVKVEKARFLQLGIEYYDEKGNLVKLFENRNVQSFHGVARASLVTVSNPRTGHRTELQIRDFRVNRDIPVSMFTVRELQWGR